MAAHLRDGVRGEAGVLAGRQGCANRGVPCEQRAASGLNQLPHLVMSVCDQHAQDRPHQ